VSAFLGSPLPEFARLFRAERFRFEFGIRPAEANWFRLAPEESSELAERRYLLREQAERHAPWSEAADSVLDEVLGVFHEPEARAWVGQGVAGAHSLAGRWEPDFVLLRRVDGQFRMVGACVCDPSWWDPAEKLGLPIEAIHAPVPQLNHELGARINTFLDRLPPGGTFTRENWGLAAVPDRNLHPALGRPRLEADLPIDRVWLRVEHQAFRALPESGGVAFLIWLTVHPLAEVVRDEATATAFFRQLATMPDDVARYKGLEQIRPSLLAGPKT